MSKQYVYYNLSVTFQAKRNHVLAIIHSPDFDVSLRFNSVEHMMEFFQGMMEEAASVWPDNEWVKEYLSEDD